MKYLICNLKANKTKEELIEYERELSSIILSPDIELVICPSTPFLFLFQNNKYKLGVQDVSKCNNGSYTGEITAEQLSSMNAYYAIVGHSERRQNFNDDNLSITQKIKNAYHHSINPIYFIGETEKEKQDFKTYKKLEEELTCVLNELPEYKREKMLIVYEPIWAIGTGEIPDYNEITEIIIFIKKIIKTYYNLELPVLYGGSVNENNIDILSSIKELDGLVLGESAQSSQSVKNIYNKLRKNI